RLRAGNAKAVLASRRTIQVDVLFELVFGAFRREKTAQQAAELSRRNVAAQLQPFLGCWLAVHLDVAVLFATLLAIENLSRERVLELPLGMFLPIAIALDLLFAQEVGKL